MFCLLVGSLVGCRFALHFAAHVCPRPPSSFSFCLASCRVQSEFKRVQLECSASGQRLQKRSGRGRKRAKSRGSAGCRTEAGRRTNRVTDRPTVHVLEMERQTPRRTKHDRKYKIKQGLALIVDNLAENPQCPHGPTLLFEYKGKSRQRIQKFYACSACRDRKDCSFYLEFGKPLSKTALKSGPTLSKGVEIWSQYIFAILVPGHHVENNVSDYQLAHPTKLLRPLQNSSKEAQFFFSENAIIFIKNALNGLQCSKLISIGTPSLLENFKEDTSFDIMLLDFDWRYSTFFGPNFYWYNMFNHHFMGTGDDPQGQKAKERFGQYLNACSKQGSYVIVMDPPFGGRVEALANTIKEIAAEIREVGRTEDIYYLWIYPYFMEPYIKAQIPETRMLDYKINYTNHPDYKIGSKLSNKQGSPVRVFTNAPLKLIPMPEAEGYKFCDSCQHHVSIENQHCFKCNACTSKVCKKKHKF
ncbi:hypothetical protein B566_EDAN001734 [Ephemera danica]|nr:hypothetical protein B566_EDAN001734 [Ephemera danica]